MTQAEGTRVQSQGSMENNGKFWGTVSSSVAAAETTAWEMKLERWARARS